MTSPDVAILMGTYEGPEFFGRQLESIIAQTVTGWKLWISDDSSSSVMRDVLPAYREALGDRMQLNDGPRRGLVANFLSLACRPDIDTRYFAFADQDDIWDADKLERALAWLDTVPESVPALYCGRVRLVDRDGRELGLSPLFSRPPGFRNALVQSLAGGNTMVFNDAARRLLLRAGEGVDVVVHDWWLYLVVTACGGTVFYDERPTLSYRLHGANQIGDRRHGGGLAGRLRGLRERRLNSWIDKNMAALARLEGALAPQAVDVLKRFADYRSARPGQRLQAFRVCGAYRQSSLDNLALQFAAALGRV